MGKSTVHVDLKDLKSFAKFLNSGVDAKEIIRKSVNELGQKHLANIIKRTPVDTGALRGSWTTEVREIADGYEVTILIPKPKESEGSQANVKTAYIYAPYVNYGHRIVKNKKTIGFVEGSFFIQRAEAQTAKSIEKVVAKHLRKWMEKNGK